MPEVPDPGETTDPEEPGEATDPETPDPGETTEPEEQVIVHDTANKEFCYLHGSDLLRIKENASFVSLYPGANTTQVWRAISEGGAVGPHITLICKRETGRESGFPLIIERTGN